MSNNQNDIYQRPNSAQPHWWTSGAAVEAGAPDPGQKKNTVTGVMENVKFSQELRLGLFLKESLENSFSQYAVFVFECG